MENGIQTQSAYWRSFPVAVEQAEINYPFLIFLILIPLQWVIILKAGPISLKAAHLAILIPFFSVFSRVSLKFSVPSAALRYAFTLNFLMIILLFISLNWSDSRLQGLMDLLRMAVYFVFGVFTLLWLLTIKPCSVVRTLGISIYGVVPVLVCVFSYYLFTSAVGANEIINSIINGGKATDIQYYFFRVVFNSGVLADSRAEDSIGSANRHGIMMFLGIISMAYIYRIQTQFSWFYKLLGGALFGFSVFLILFSLSRSAILVFVVSALTACAYQIIKVGITKFWVYIGLAFTVLLVYFSSSSDILTSISQVFSTKFIDDIVNNPRVFEFFQIIDFIGQRPIIGYGAGSHLDLVGLQATYPHNLFMYMWHQSGALGFILSVVCFCCFVYTFCKFVKISLLVEYRAKSYLFLTAAIFILPALLRMCFAKTGLMSFTEWTGVSISAVLSYYASHMVSNNDELSVNEIPED